MTSATATKVITERYHCLTFDSRHQRFAIYLSPTNQVYFSYWLEFKQHGVRELAAGQEFSAEISDRNHLPHARGKALSHVVCHDDQRINPAINRNQRIHQAELATQINELNDYPLIFVGCQFSDIQLEQLQCARELVFIDCEFAGNVRFLDCQFAHSIWFPNCRFNQHFSLRGSHVRGNVHLEGADFSGLGGISMRGLHANNLYLDLGVTGGNDLVWLNEMTIVGAVSIGGQFHGDIQLLQCQDSDTPLCTTATIGNLIIGKELYQAENANRTHINGRLIIQGLTIQGAIVAEHLQLNALCMHDNTLAEVHLLHCDVSKDIEFIGNQQTAAKNITLRDCSVGRHLKLDRNDIVGTLDLTGTAVSEVSYLEDNNFAQSTKLKLKRFTSARVLISPVSALHGNSRWRLFAPRAFGLLTADNNKELAEQYCTLKHWLADAGQLDYEDAAFFHMREKSQSNWLRRFFFGGIFGWGVQLRNILWSSVVFMLAFAAVYWWLIDGLSPTKAIALSAQSFISSFFGAWHNYPPDGYVATLVTTQSFIGILLVTIFIGAYIRKLLR